MTSAQAGPSARAGGPSRQRRKASPGQGQKACFSCAGCWPWAHFQDDLSHASSVFAHTTGVCTRCDRPDLEMQRWSGLYDDMRLQMQLAQDKLKQKQVATARKAAARASEAQLTAEEDYPTRLLMDEDLLSDLEVQNWQILPEPTRAAIWLQLNFRPDPSARPIRQVHLFQLYQAAMAADPGAANVLCLSGHDLIKLACRLWGDDAVSIKGAPDYTVVGLGQITKASSQPAALTVLPADQARSFPNVVCQSIGPSRTNSADSRPALIANPGGPSHRHSVVAGSNPPHSGRQSHPNHEVIVIDDDSTGISEDEWGGFQPRRRKKAKTAGSAVRPPIPEVSSRAPVTLSVRPRSRPASTPIASMYRPSSAPGRAHGHLAAATLSSFAQDTEPLQADPDAEEIDELDEDEYHGDLVETEDGRGARESSEDQVGHLLE
ncbi:hypothetical protein IAU60_006772 [Kwoniella sp. DSM 27419]